MADLKGVKSAIEGVLFVSQEPVSMSSLEKALDGVSKEEIKTALKELLEEYRPDARGIYLAEVADGYQFRTSPTCAEVVRKFLETKASKLSMRALEVLAIAAYRQPITKPEIDKIRGVDSGGVITNLLERGLLKILGRREVPGRPFVYGTAKRFLEVFSLKSLSELPSIEEIEEMLGRKGELQKILDSAQEEEQPIVSDGEVAPIEEQAGENKQDVAKQVESPESVAEEEDNE